MGVSISNAGNSPKDFHPTRIVTVCIRGEQAENIEENAKREDILKSVTREIISKRWSGIDAIIFPGGFFYLSDNIGQLSFEERMETLEHASFHNECLQASEDLVDLSSNIFIIAGVDSIAPSRPWIDDELGDQLCVAWASERIAAIGRKVFPVLTRKCHESFYFVCYKDDFGTNHRVINLSSGKNAILAACYDLFGCAEKTDSPTTRTSNIRYINDGLTLHKDSDSDFKDIRRECIGRFQDLILKQKVSIGITAIHNFKKPGRDIFWQRHGIATCSATLQGLGIGAAHFEEILPKWNRSTLASGGVPKSHVNMSSNWNRKAHSLAAIDHFFVNDMALVRLFEW